MDRLLSMRTFRQVATEGSFAAAARVLDMSPAVVTRLVVDLEEHLGTRLIQRTTRRMVLTEAGRLYLERVEHILDAMPWPVPRPMPCRACCACMHRPCWRFTYWLR